MHPLTASLDMHGLQAQTPILDAFLDRITTISIHYPDVRAIEDGRFTEVSALEMRAWSECASFDCIP